MSLIAPKTFGDRRRVLNKFIAEAKNIGLAGVALCRSALVSMKQATGCQKQGHGHGSSQTD
jgi:hypothetical protein